MVELLQRPWHWAVAGIVIGLTVPALLLLGNKKFGISSSLRHICAAVLPANIPFFQYDWKKEIWNLFFAAGIAIGAFVATSYLQNPNDIEIAKPTLQRIESYGIKDHRHLLPDDLFNWQNLLTAKGVVFMIAGGFLIGFGSRYAGGCTSGHSIMGLSNLQWPSLVATVSFMAGGFFSANIIIPFLFKTIFQ